MKITNLIEGGTAAETSRAPRLPWRWLWSMLTCFAALGCGSDLAPSGSDDDDPIAEVSEALSSHTVSSNWQCPSGVTCDDVYDFDVPGDTFVTIKVTRITGGSFLRLAAFGPSSSTNLLTGGGRDWNCQGTGTDSVTFKAPSSGTYRLALGRDASRSGGTTGEYTVTFEGLPSMTFLRQSGNNVSNNRSQIQCGWEQLINASFSCNPGPTCQNVWDYDVQAGSVITLSTGVPSATAALSQRLHAPGVALGGVNLLIGHDQGRRCAPITQQENASIKVFPQGRYRVAITQEGTAPGPSSGSYTQLVRSDRPMIARGQTVFNGPGNTRGVTCKSGHHFSTFLNCASNVACMDYYAFSMVTASVVELDLIQSSGLPRLTVYPSSGTTNQLNNTTRDRQCKANNVPDFAATLQPVSGGAFRVGVGRSSGGEPGRNYILNVRASQPFTFTGQISNDTTPNVATSCP